MKLRVINFINLQENDCGNGNWLSLVKEDDFLHNIAKVFCLSRNRCPSCRKAMAKVDCEWIKYHFQEKERIFAYSVRSKKDRERIITRLGNHEIEWIRAGNIILIGKLHNEFKKVRIKKVLKLAYAELVKTGNRNERNISSSQGVKGKTVSFLFYIKDNSNIEYNGQAKYGNINKESYYINWLESKKYAPSFPTLATWKHKDKEKSYEFQEMFDDCKNPKEKASLLLKLSKQDTNFRITKTGHDFIEKHIECEESLNDSINKDRQMNTIRANTIGVDKLIKLQLEYWQSFIGFMNNCPGSNMAINKTDSIDIDPTFLNTPVEDIYKSYVSVNLVN